MRQKKTSVRHNPVALLGRRLSSAKANPKTQYIYLTIKEAQGLLDMKTQFVETKYDPKANSTKAAALILCVPPEVLADLLNNPPSNKLRNDLVEARNKQKMLEGIAKAAMKDGCDKVVLAYELRKVMEL